MTARAGGVSSAASPSAGPPVMVIDKLTQGYDRFEDRISIDVQDAAGRVLRLWVTRRLADILFGHLGRALSAEGFSRDADFARHMQVWEQQAAQSRLRGDEPVRWQGEAVLLTAIDINRSDKGTQLVFKSALAGVDYPVASVTLGEVHLRQWLGIVYQLYAAAGWPVAAWPQWFADAQRAPENDPDVAPQNGLH